MDRVGKPRAVALGVLVATTTICALLLYAEAVSVAVLRDRLARARFQFYAGVEDQVEIVEGRFPLPAIDPQGVVEVMITEPLAEELGLHVGDLFHVEDFAGGAQPMQVQVRLAAIIRLFRQIVALPEPALSSSKGTALIVATHDRAVYDLATVVYELEDGQLTRHTGSEA